MDGQLRWIVELLDRVDIGYWVDSGTLLGLVRDGKLLEHDGDIDIGIWRHDAPRLADLIALVQKSSYETRVIKYDGKPCKLKLVPNDSTMRTIDINIYQISSGHAWCIAIVPRVLCTKRQLVNALTREWWAVWRNIRMLVHILLRHLLIKFRLGYDVTGYPWRHIYQVWTWWIPADLLEERQYQETLLVWSPARKEEYLQYRYGDWRVPIRDWVYIRDDKGLVHTSPETVVLSKPY